MSGLFLKAHLNTVVESTALKVNYNKSMTVQLITWLKNVIFMHIPLVAQKDPFLSLTWVYLLA